MAYVKVFSYAAFLRTAIIDLQIRFEQDPEGVGTGFSLMPDDYEAMGRYWAAMYDAPHDAYTVKPETPWDTLYFWTLRHIIDRPSTTSYGMLVLETDLRFYRSVYKALKSWYKHNGGRDGL